MAIHPPSDNARLSVEACRRLLGTCGEGLSDSEIESTRHQLYGLASCVIAAYEFGPQTEVETNILASVSDDDRAEIEERAAILQFDAKMSRPAADRLAFDSGAFLAKARRMARGGLR
jgi:hypothetical protein